MENACRNQMAEAFFNQMSKTAKANSAGTKPASSVNPLAVEAMEEVGIDISKAKPKLLTLEMLERTDQVITMDCTMGDVCPGAIVETENWWIENPTSKSIEKFREVRDVIMGKVEKALLQYCVGGSAPSNFHIFNGFIQDILKFYALLMLQNLF